MITTSNPEFDKKFRLWRQHGMSVPDTVRHGSREVIFESYPEVGFNYRMTDMQAAVGRVQLTRLGRIIDDRRRIAARYAEQLTSIPAVSAPREPAWARSNWQSYCVRVAASCDQRSIMQSMLDDGISTRRGVMNAHLELPYQQEGAAHALSNSEAAQQAIILPLAPDMTERDLQHICDTFRSAVRSLS
jgi:dTDP-4-amino-4,6-dideoxygalactose transaminase